jgi:hypothetical protein
MLQIVINHSNFVSSRCYLKGFRFKEGAEIGIYGERSKTRRVTILEKFAQEMTIMHNCLQGVIASHG